MIRLIQANRDTDDDDDIYSTFSPSTMDDKEKDDILHHKINIFRWVRERHLDIPVIKDNDSFLTFAESGITFNL